MLGGASTLTLAINESDNSRSKACLDRSKKFSFIFADTSNLRSSMDFKSGLTNLRKSLFTSGNISLSTLFTDNS